MSDERRHSDRAPARKLAYIKRADAHHEMYELVDLSPGGMRILTGGEAFEVDERIHVELDVENSSIELPGRIAHMKDGEAGVEFLDVAEEAQNKLELFVISQGWDF